MTELPQAGETWMDNSDKAQPFRKWSMIFGFLHFKNLPMEVMLEINLNELCSYFPTVHISHLALSLRSWPSEWEGAEDEKGSIPVFLTGVLWAEKIWFKSHYKRKQRHNLLLPDISAGEAWGAALHKLPTLFTVSASRKLLPQMLWPFHHRNSDWAALTLPHMGTKFGPARDKDYHWTKYSGSQSTMSYSPSSKRLLEPIPCALPIVPGLHSFYILP